MPLRARRYPRLNTDNEMPASGASKRDPRWVDAILDWRWTWLIARISLTGPFMVGAFMKLSDLNAAFAEQEHFGLYPGWAWGTLTIIVEIVGPALIISRRFVWFGAGMLAVFTAIANLLANHFWTMTGEARFNATNGFFEHIAMIAGFILAAMIAEHERLSGDGFQVKQRQMMSSRASAPTSSCIQAPSGSRLEFRQPP